MKRTLNAKEICEAIAYAAGSKGVNRGEGKKEVRLIASMNENGDFLIYAEVEEMT